ncbi:MAG TPA: hypothetical protein VFP65_04495 [Anaeromyxobacteraceae bacterium]|nr:hypothetical protein [Anaeromyxobacteraceae bacterium]
MNSTSTSAGSSPGLARGTWIPHLLQGGAGQVLPLPRPRARVQRRDGAVPLRASLVAVALAIALAALTLGG